VKRGDLVVVALPGDYGKPRPALVVQSDLFNDAHASITVAPVSSTIVNTPLFRVTVERFAAEWFAAGLADHGRQSHYRTAANDLVRRSVARKKTSCCV
jgi:PemK-like, MazF-like toxin of type II toxin-antitoxin system